jgi:hypothetical protein
LQLLSSCMTRPIKSGDRKADHPGHGAAGYTSLGEG